MVAVMRPFGEIVIPPFEVQHTSDELNELASLIKNIDGETRTVMEHTGNYHVSIAQTLRNAGIYVPTVNAMLVHDYGNNSLRRAKTDKKYAVKLANYALDNGLSLPKYAPEEDARLMLRNCYRQYEQYPKMRTMFKNNLISLLDQTFPGANIFSIVHADQMAVKNGLTLSLIPGISSAFASLRRRCLLRAIKDGCRCFAQEMLCG